MEAMYRFLLLILVLPASAMAQPVPVTTDTPEYCVALAERLIAMRDLPVPVATKISEGRRMCRTGRVRDGIVTLRHCAMMLHMDALDFPPAAP